MAPAPAPCQCLNGAWERVLIVRAQTNPWSFQWWTRALLTGRDTNLGWDKEGNHWGCGHCCCLSQATYLPEASQSGVPLNTSELPFALGVTRGLPGSAAGLAMAVVLLSLVMQPLKHRCLCSHKLVTASAQFTTGTATEIPAEGTF